MEINYFLDSQQIMYENLIADVGLEGEIFKSCEQERRQRHDRDENNDDTTTMMTDVDNKEGEVDDEIPHDENINSDNKDDIRNNVEKSDSDDED